MRAKAKEYAAKGCAVSCLTALGVYCVAMGGTIVFETITAKFPGDLTDRVWSGGWGLLLLWVGVLAALGPVLSPRGALTPVGRVGAVTVGASLAVGTILVLVESLEAPLVSPDAGVVAEGQGWQLVSISKRFVEGCLFPLVMTAALLVGSCFLVWWAFRGHRVYPLEAWKRSAVK